MSCLHSSLGQEDPLEKKMSTHSSILAWKIPWTEEPGGLQSMGSQRVGHDWATNTHICIPHIPSSFWILIFFFLFIKKNLVSKILKRMKTTNEDRWAMHYVMIKQVFGEINNVQKQRRFKYCCICNCFILVIRQKENSFQMKSKLAVL